MATVRKRQGKKKTRYFCEVCVNGARKGATLDTRHEALAWGARIEDGLRKGGYFGDQPAGDLLFSVASRRYEADILPHKKPNTRAREVTILNHLDRFFGHQLLSEIDTPRAAEYRNLRARAVKKDTFLREFNVLSDLFNVARTEWGCSDLINPVKELKLPAKSTGRINFATELDARRLVEACCGSKNGKLTAYVLQQMHTGMRPSEGAGIMWRHYDLKNCAIELPVTKTTQRWVPVNPVVIKQVARLKKRSTRLDDYVFLPPDPALTLQLRPSLHFRRSFDTARRLIGRPDLTLHDLRHTAASHMLMAGVDIRTIMEIIGHTTLEMLTKYTHLVTDHKREAVGKISNLGL